MEERVACCSADRPEPLQTFSDLPYVLLNLHLLLLLAGAELVIRGGLYRDLMVQFPAIQTPLQLEQERLDVGEK